MGRPKSKPMGHQTWRKVRAYGSSVEKPPKGRPKPKPMAHQTWRKFRRTANGQTKVQTYGPPNLEKIACLQQQCRKNRHRADQGPNPWATKPGENCTLTAAMATRPPTGRPKPNLDLAVDPLSMKTGVAVQGCAQRGEATSSRV